MTKLIAQIPSKSNPSKLYNVNQQDDESYTCDCMDFMTRRRYKGEHCKHIKETLEALAEMEKMAGASA